MKNFVAIGVLLSLLSCCSCSALYFNFDNLEQYDTPSGRYVRLPTQELKIEAQFNQSQIILTLTYINEQGKFTIDSTPFFNMTYWQNNVYTDYIGKTGNKEDREFLYKNAFNLSSASPCGRIYNTNSYLCFLRIRSSMDRIKEEGSTMPLYLRVRDSSYSNASIELLGGSYFLTDGPLSQRDVEYTNHTQRDLELNITQKTANSSDPERHICVVSKGYLTKKILKQITPAFYYFNCPKFTMLVESHEFRPLLYLNQTSINLASLGLPFEENYNYTCKASFIVKSIHNEMNLVPIKTQIEAQVSRKQHIVRAEEKLISVTEELARLSDILKEIRGSGCGSRLLASKSLRSLMQKVSSVVVRTA